MNHINHDGLLSFHNQFFSIASVIRLSFVSVVYPPKATFLSLKSESCITMEWRNKTELEDNELQLIFHCNNARKMMVVLVSMILRNE